MPYNQTIDTMQVSKDGDMNDMYGFWTFRNDHLHSLVKSILDLSIPLPSIPTFQGAPPHITVKKYNLSCTILHLISNVAAFDIYNPFDTQLIHVVATIYVPNISKTQWNMADEKEFYLSFSYFLPPNIIFTAAQITPNHLSLHPFLTTPLQRLLHSNQQSGPNSAIPTQPIIHQNMCPSPGVKKSTPTRIIQTQLTIPTCNQSPS